MCNSLPFPEAEREQECHKDLWVSWLWVHQGGVPLHNQHPGKEEDEGKADIPLQ